MSNYTKFKVIKIIDEYSIVINGGLMDDISLEDEIEVFLEGDEVKDPFNENKVLGTLDYIKEKLIVTEIYTKFSVCKKIKKEKVKSPSVVEKALIPTFQKSLLPYFNDIYGSSEIKVSEEKINVKKDEMTGRRIGDKVISIGDIARIALSEDE